jgi:hypothetical protein
VQTVPESGCMQIFADQQLRLGIPRPDRPHVL